MHIMQGADGMERATKLKVVVFDKTGTLTAGKPSVLDVKLFDKEVCVPVALLFPQQLSLPQQALAHSARMLCIRDRHHSMAASWMAVLHCPRQR